ncbi:flagellar hook assembly protein FlgD [Aureibacillus halotolerans]|uniref:Basal-body rod modification protein FlgD n=1 Tax=Aureibacillus halotolerans TaxID=1508390 RepID=A0A4R6U2R4_9BACI|nr:flagellar hook assembly protein FlgD [Aureibacillus halotolerans]TDQ39652.1 flagellar hook capping protein [Aureibacillus halotolerans]
MSPSIGNQYDLPTQKATMLEPKETMREAGDKLDKDDFLKLLILQLQHQDPMSPMEDREFIAQMASFSSLEQMTNLNKTFEEFASKQSQNGLTAAAELLGKTIRYQNGEGEGEAKTGIVTSVFSSSQGITYQLEDGTKVPEASIVSISETDKPEPEAGHQQPVVPPIPETPPVTESLPAEELTEEGQNTTAPLENGTEPSDDPTVPDESAPVIPPIVDDPPVVEPPLEADSPVEGTEPPPSDAGDEDSESSENGGVTEPVEATDEPEENQQEEPQEETDVT